MRPCGKPNSKIANIEADRSPAVDHRHPTEVNTSQGQMFWLDDELVTNTPLNPLLRGEVGKHMPWPLNLSFGTTQETRSMDSLLSDLDFYLVFKELSDSLCTNNHQHDVAVMEDSISRLQGCRCTEIARSGIGREGIEGCVNEHELKQ